MKKKYDLVVIGAGLSSLMFLHRYLKKFKNHSILILESKDEIKKDQTFCVWEGPGILSIQKYFNLKPKKIWDEILIQNKNKKIIRDINPYKYVCFDGYETFKKLIKASSSQIEIRFNTLIEKIEKEQNIFKLFSKDKMFQGNYVIDSRKNYLKKDIASIEIKQAFVGHEIELTKNTFTPNQATLMSFKENNKEVEFTYILPFTKRKALIETTVFSKNPNFKYIEKKHKDFLKLYEKYKVVRTEKAIIPMAIIKNSYKDDFLKIGMSVGMVRPSSGYSMRRIANWISSLKIIKLSSTTQKYYIYKQNWLLNWLDSIFLKVIYFYPNQGPELFIQLFSKVNMPSLIRFLSDKPSFIDLMIVLWSMPKKLMIKGLKK